MDFNRVDPARAPANARLLQSLGRNRPDRPALAAPDSVEDPYWKAGSHPDVVEWVWDKLGPALPGTGRVLVYGTPALIHRASTVIVASAYGTRHVIRLLPEHIAPAVAAGGQASARWTGGGTTDITAEFGPDWLFAPFDARLEIDWLRATCESLRPAPDRAG